MEQFSCLLFKKKGGNTAHWEKMKSFVQLVSQYFWMQIPISIINVWFNFGKFYQRLVFFVSVKSFTLVVCYFEEGGLKIKMLILPHSVEVGKNWHQALQKKTRFRRQKLWQKLEDQFTWIPFLWLAGEKYILMVTPICSKWCSQGFGWLFLSFKLFSISNQHKDLYTFLYWSFLVCETLDSCLVWISMKRNRYLS